ncbi:hypothetical protein Tco_0083646 [Tanacetum coccineum]
MKSKNLLNVTFDETPPPPKTSPLEDDDLVEEEAIEVNKTRPLGNDLEDKSLENNEIINIKESKSHPLDNVIGNLNQRTLRSQAQDKSGVDGNGSNPSGGFGKPGGGREIRDGIDGLEGPDGQFFMV